MQSLCLFSPTRTKDQKEGEEAFHLFLVSKRHTTVSQYQFCLSLKAYNGDAIRLCIMLFSMFKADETVSCNPCVIMLVLTDEAWVLVVEGGWAAAGCVEPGQPHAYCRAQDVLVATDVASKGLDFPDIQHVINFDMPDEIENYVRAFNVFSFCRHPPNAKHRDLCCDNLPTEHRLWFAYPPSNVT